VVQAAETARRQRVAAELTVVTLFAPGVMMLTAQAVVVVQVAQVDRLVQQVALVVQELWGDLKMSHRTRIADQHRYLVVAVQVIRAPADIAIQQPMLTCQQAVAAAVVAAAAADLETEQPAETGVMVEEQ